MDDLSAADVEGYMVDASAGGIKEKVTCLETVQAHGSAASCLRGCSSGKSDTEVGKNGLNETGAVGAVGQACSAPYIRIADELQTVFRYRNTHFAAFSHRIACAALGTCRCAA